MLVVKSLHIWMVVSWFAGLFYLPRIFVNLAMVPAESAAEYDRLLLMAGAGTACMLQRASSHGPPYSGTLIWLSRTEAKARRRRWCRRQTLSGW